MPFLMLESIGQEVVVGVQKIIWTIAKDRSIVDVAGGYFTGGRIAACHRYQHEKPKRRSSFALFAERRFCRLGIDDAICGRNNF